MIIYVKQKITLPPPSAGLPSGFTSLDYITVGLNDYIIRDEAVGASDVVFLDHQFEALPTWGLSAYSSGSFFWLYRDSYRMLKVKPPFSLGTTQIPDTYSYYPADATNSDVDCDLSTERVFMCMPITALSVNGVIFPASTLTSMSIAIRADIDSGEDLLSSASCRIYGCYVLDALDWRHYMVPCMRVSDGREGLYDLVDGVFIAILFRNIIDLSDNVITSTYPVASDLTIGIRAVGSTATITFPNGSSSVSAGSRATTITSIAPTYDDAYYYIIG